MSHRKKHTSCEPFLQVSDPASADWQQLVQERLPSNLESQARTLGAFVRVRRISSASLLLRAILCYVLSLSSLKDLSMWSRLVGGDQQGGFSLTRFSPHHLPLYAAQAPSCSSAFQFDVNGWLHSLSPGVYERQALVHCEQTTLSVRVIAIVPTPEKAAALRR